MKKTNPRNRFMCEEEKKSFTSLQDYICPERVSRSINNEQECEIQWEALQLGVDQPAIVQHGVLHVIASLFSFGKF